jgi:hypothetical protein
MSPRPVTGLWVVSRGLSSGRGARGISAADGAPRAQPGPSAPQAAGAAPAPGSATQTAASAAGGVQAAAADAASTPAYRGPPLDFAERLAVCGACEHAREPLRGFPTWCSECGCAIQAKAFFEAFHCPIGKW